MPIILNYKLGSRELAKTLYNAGGMPIIGLKSINNQLKEPLIKRDMETALLKIAELCDDSNLPILSFQLLTCKRDVWKKVYDWYSIKYPEIVTNSFMEEVRKEEVKKIVECRDELWKDFFRKLN